MMAGWWWISFFVFTIVAVVVANNLDNRQSGGGAGGTLQRSLSTGEIDVLRRKKPESCNLNYEFDYFVLSIQWPSSFCVEKQECNLQIARKKKWLIHGLWPNRFRRQTLGGGNSRNKRNQFQRQNIAENLDRQLHQQSNPDGLRRGGGGGNHGGDNAEFCCGPKYNSSLMKGNIYQELLDKWPTLHPNGRHHSFWQHEWQKHGTCARQIRPLRTQQNYFETILNLYNRFNLTTVKFQHGKTYSIQDVHQMIEPRVDNKRVRLECSLVDAKTNITGGPTGQRGHHNSNRGGAGSQQSPSQKISIFSEVHICLDKQLRPIDCPHRDDYQCKRNILFP